MPNWKLHNKWAFKFGIPIEISNWVNKREDLPKFNNTKDKGLQNFRKEYGDEQPTYDEIKSKGESYLRAWMLHILIDELEDICEDTKLSEIPHEIDIYDYIIGFYNTNSLLRLIPDDITKFVLNNAKEMMEEFDLPYFKMAVEGMSAKKKFNIYNSIAIEV